MFFSHVHTKNQYIRLLPFDGTNTQWMISWKASSFSYYHERNKQKKQKSFPKSTNLKTITEANENDYRMWNVERKRDLEGVTNTNGKQCQCD